MKDLKGLTERHRIKDFFCFFNKQSTITNIPIYITKLPIYIKLVTEKLRLTKLKVRPFSPQKFYFFFKCPI